MRVADLLSIDVTAELRTICSEQLHGPWQLPVELVRYAIRRGAEAVDVARSGRGVVLRCPGTGSIRGQLERLVVVLDPAAADDDRHLAVVDLEREGAHALLWTAGAAGATLRIASRKGGSATVFELRPEQRPRLVVDAPDDVVGGFEVELSVPDLDLRRAFEWVHTACRFSPVPVTVNNREVAQGFEQSLCSVSLGSPVVGGIALTMEGDAPHLWLLRHGVLAGRAALPDHPPFEAALEMGDLTADNASPDELRAAVNPHVSALVDISARLLVDVVTEGVERNRARSERLVTLVFRTAAKGLRPDEVEALAVIPTVDLMTGVRRRLALADVRTLCDRGVELWSAPPNADPRRLPGDERTVVMLTDEQHGLLVDLLGVAISRPEPRHSQVRSRYSLRRAWDGVRRAGARVLAGGDPTILPESRLLSAELRLVRELARIVTDREGRSLEVRICAGPGSVRVRDGELLVPRNDPQVVQIVRLLESGDEWLLPTALALLDDHGRVSPELRSRWRRMVWSAQPPG